MRYPDKTQSGGNPSCELDPAVDVDRQLRHAGRAARSILVRPSGRALHIPTA
jgi:hypothetical protein